MATLAINPETAAPLPYDLANVPDGFWERASTPTRLRDLKVGSRDMVLLAITANTGKPLSKWELGEAFRRLIRFGWDEAAVSKKTGYTTRFVSEAVELADAPQEIKELLSAAAVTPSLALATLRTNGSEATAILKARVEVAKSNGQTTAKRGKAPTSAGKEKAKDVSSLVLYAAEALAVAVDRWREDATDGAETAVIKAHEAYRKLIRAPKREEAA